jgi:DNA-directed RNA polymerase specialized sigma24 family protein
MEENNIFPARIWDRSDRSVLPFMGHLESQQTVPPLAENALASRETTEALLNRFDRYIHKLSWRAAQSYGLHAEDREDIMQDIRLRLLRMPADSRSSDPLIYTHIKHGVNKAVRHLKSRGATPGKSFWKHGTTLDYESAVTNRDPAEIIGPPLDKLKCAESDEANVVARITLRKAAETVLTGQQRLVMSLSDDGYSDSEIASRLSLERVYLVSKLRQSAINKLRKYFEDPATAHAEQERRTKAKTPRTWKVLQPDLIKTCRSCGHTGPAGLGFVKDEKSKGGYANICQVCKTERRKRRAEATRPAKATKRVRYKGVSERDNKFEANIYIAQHGKVKYIGTFPTAEEAALAYNEEALKLYGEHAVLNDIPLQAE